MTWLVSGLQLVHSHECAQIAGDPTGLTLNNGNAIDFTTAVTAINKLRDALGGTASSSVENGLTRTPTAVTGVQIASPGPNLFASDANSVAFTRILVSFCSPYCDLSRQSAVCSSLAEQHQLTVHRICAGSGVEHSVLW